MTRLRPTRAARSVPRQGGEVCSLRALTYRHAPYKQNESNTVTKPNPIDVRRERQRLAHDKAARWLAKHSDDAPLIEPKAERRRKRKEAYEQDRTRRRNAAVRRGRAGASKTTARYAAC